MKAVQEPYDLANEINRDIARAWGRSIEFVANVNLASTVVVKGWGAIPGPGWLLALGYDVVTGTIEDLSQANQANGVVVVATTNGIVEGGKEVAEETAEWVVDKLNNKPTGKELQHAP